MPDHARECQSSKAISAASRRSLAIWIWSVLFIADAVLVTRRLSGEFENPLPVGLGLLSAAIVALASIAAWRLFSDAKTDSVAPRWYQWQSRGLSLSATVLWAWSVSAGASPQSAGLLFGVVAILLSMLLAVDLGEAASSRATGLHLKTDRSELVGSRQLNVPDEEPASVGFLQEAVDPVLEDAEEGALGEMGSECDDSLTLWLSRRQTDDGEQIEGWVRVPFADGQRETSVHVAFCPPMSACPEIETEELDGGDLEIRVAAVFPFGVRLSVRRSGELDERNSDRIGFTAHASSAQRAA